MSGVNKVILLGRLGKDPESKTLQPSGVVVTTFSVATSEKYKDKTTNELKEVTEWTSVVLYRGIAETAAKYLKKGDNVFIEGRLKTRSWEKDGVTHYRTEVIGESMNLIGSKAGGQHNGSSSTPAPVEAVANTGDNSTDDLPF